MRVGLCTECCTRGVEETSWMVKGGVAVSLENAVVGLKQVTCKKWVCLKFAWLPTQT